MIMFDEPNYIDYEEKPDKILIEWEGFLFNPKFIQTITIEVENDVKEFGDSLLEIYRYKVIFNKDFDGQPLCNKTFIFPSSENRKSQLKNLLDTLESLKTQGYYVKLISN